MKLAVLMACHNRRQKTVDCLDALFRNALPAGWSVEVFLMDDGSTDGTSDAVRARFQNVHLLRGDGSLFWNRGMHEAFGAALQAGADAYMWLNDDTMLYPATLGTLFDTWHEMKQRYGDDVIVVGSTRDAATAVLTYGGIRQAARWRPMTFMTVEPQDVPVECESMWGNCVLIPASVTRRLGNLDPRFAHSMGDMDYGLRARRLGIRIVVMPGYAGTCSMNSARGTWEDPDVPLRQRMKKVLQPKGMPLRSWRILTQRHAGPFWPLYWLWPYFKIIATSLVRR